MRIGLLLGLLALTSLSAHAEPALLACGHFSGAGVEPDHETERLCLAKLTGRVWREPCALRLRLDSGAVKTYRERSSACGLDPEHEVDHESYALLAWFPRAHTYLLHMTTYEAVATRFVSSRTGVQQSAGVGLHVSPDGQTVAELNETEEKDQAVIWTLKGEAVRTVPRPAPDHYHAWSFEGWDGPDRVLASLRQEPLGPGRTPQSAEITRDAMGWTIHYDPPSDLDKRK